MSGFIHNFFGNSQFKRNVFVLFSGAVVSQLIYLIASPLLTRLYTPEQFGLLAIFISITTILTLIVTGQYELSISLPKEENDARHIAIGTIAVSFITSTIIFFLAFLFQKPLLELLNFKQHLAWIFLVPLLVFISSVNQVFYYWVVYKGRFKALTSNNISKVTVTNLSQLGFQQRLLSINNGLIFGQVVGALCSTVLYLRNVFVNDRFFHDRVCVSSIREQLARYRRFPLLTMPSLLINVFANQLPTILLGGMFGITVAGQYSLTQKVLGVPSALIGTSMLTAFKERASRDFRETGSCRYIYVKMLKTLFLIAVIPFLFMITFSQKLIPMFFGANWALAGKFAQILSLMFFMRFIASPLSYVLVIAEKQKISFVWQLSLLISSTASLALGWVNHDAVLGIATFSVLYTVLYTIMIFLTYTYSKKTY